MPESKAVARVLSSGYMLDAKAFDVISTLPPGIDVDGLVERLLVMKAGSPGEAKVITEDDVKRLIPHEEPQKEWRSPISDTAELEVISDPTQAIAPVEGAEGFGKLFRDRYQRLFSIVKERLDT